MTIKSIPAGLWEWFGECAKITRLFFNFSDSEDGATAIVPAGDTVVENYIDGSQRRQYTFELVRFMPVSTEENDTSNLQMQEEMESIIEWVNAQNDDGNFPAMPSGKVAESIEIPETQTGYVAMQDQNIAKYMIPFALTYIKE